MSLAATRPIKAKYMQKQPELVSHAAPVIREPLASRICNVVVGALSSTAAIMPWLSDTAGGEAAVAG